MAAGYVLLGLGFARVTTSPAARAAAAAVLTQRG
jgi:hypothetical protein